MLGISGLLEAGPTAEPEPQQGLLQAGTPEDTELLQEMLPEAGVAKMRSSLFFPLSNLSLGSSLAKPTILGRCSSLKSRVE